MGTIDDYLATLDPGDADAIEKVYAIARGAAPEAEQGTGYGMPALVYRGKALISVMRAKHHIGIHPFSADAVAAAADVFDGFDVSKGTIRFQPDSPPPDPAIRTLVHLRRTEIDG